MSMKMPHRSRRRIEQKRLLLPFLFIKSPIPFISSRFLWSCCSVCLLTWSSDQPQHLNRCLGSLDATSPFLVYILFCISPLTSLSPIHRTASSLNQCRSSLLPWSSYSYHPASARRTLTLFGCWLSFLIMTTMSCPESSSTVTIRQRLIVLGFESLSGLSPTHLSASIFVKTDFPAYRRVCLGLPQISNIFLEEHMTIILLFSNNLIENKHGFWKLFSKSARFSFLRKKSKLVSIRISTCSCTSVIPHLFISFNFPYFICSTCWYFVLYHTLLHCSFSFRNTIDASNRSIALSNLNSDMFPFRFVIFSSTRTIRFGKWFALRLERRLTSSTR